MYQFPFQTGKFVTDFLQPCSKLTTYFLFHQERNFTNVCHRRPDFPVRVINVKSVWCLTSLNMVPI